MNRTVGGALSGVHTEEKEIRRLLEGFIWRGYNIDVRGDGKERGDLDWGYKSQEHSREGSGDISMSRAKCI